MKLYLVIMLSLASVGYIEVQLQLITSPVDHRAKKIKSLDQNQTTQIIEVDKNNTAAWKNLFIKDNKIKIGIYCNTTHHKSFDTNTTLTIRSFLPLTFLPNISLYALDHVEERIIPDYVTVYHFDTETKESFLNFAAIIQQMDIIITTEPMIAYITEALQKPSWFILNTEAIDTAFMDRHPNIQLFKQTSNDDVIFTIMHELAYLNKKNLSNIITAEIAIGELIDKITILEIKTERIDDPKKLENIWKELNSLRDTLNESVVMTAELQHLTQQLKIANEHLWITEDLIREKERDKCFDDEFIQLARKVYIQNDARCYAKRRINELLGSRLIEEKSYKPYV